MHLRSAATTTLLILAALVATPAAARADLIGPPDTPVDPASDPPPSEPANGDGADATVPSDDEPTAEAEAGSAPSVQGPPKGGCASCRVGEPESDRAAWPLAVALGAAALAHRRRRSVEPT